MTNYNTTFSEGNTLACRNNGINVEAHGAGHYEQKAYNPIIKILCKVDYLALRTVTTCTTKYEILWDGEVFNNYPTLKTAEKMFIDLAGITPKKYEKLAKAMA